jgi:hypothetical protein
MEALNMSNPKVHVIKAASGKFTITGQPALLTIIPAKINTAIEKSNLLDTKKIILTGIILKLTEQGVIKTEKLISKVYSAFINDPDSWNKFIEIIKSITSSNN